MKKRYPLLALLTATALAGAGLYHHEAHAQNQQDGPPWIEAYETSPRHVHIWAGNFPGKKQRHQIILGGYRPAPGVPSGPGSHWFAGHAGPISDDNGEVEFDYIVPNNVACGQTVPFIACDQNAMVGGCLSWNGPIGTLPYVVTADPSPVVVTCP